MAVPIPTANPLRQRRTRPGMAIRPHRPARWAPPAAKAMPACLPGISEADGDADRVGRRSLGWC